jgi:predicted DNA-binding protein (UPF0251 family)
LTPEEKAQLRVLQKILTAKEIEALLMHHHGLTNSEAARMLGIFEAAFRQRITGALRRVERALPSSARH